MTSSTPGVVIALAIAFGMVPHQEEDPLRGLRRARAGLVNTSTDLGVLAKTRLSFLLPPGRTSHDSSIFVMGAGRMRYDLHVPGAGRLTMLLDGERFFYEAKHENRSGFQNDEGSMAFYRANAAMYHLLFRFPYLRRGVEIRPGAAGASSFQIEGLGVEATLTCDPGTMLATRIRLAGGAFECSEIEWGRAERCLPERVQVPLRWKVDSYSPDQTTWREELDEIYFDVSAPADLIDAHRDPAPGRKVEYSGMRPGQGATRWSAIVAQDLYRERGWSMDLEGYLEMLASVPAAPASGALEGTAIEGPLLGLDLRGGEMLLLRSRGDESTSSVLSRETRMMTHFVSSALSTAEILGAIPLGKKHLVLLAPGSAESGPRITGLTLSLED